MEESIWNEITSEFEPKLSRPLSRKRVEELFKRVDYDDKKVMIIFRISINNDFFMLTDEEIAAAAEVEANAADAADVFEDFDNMPDTADQPPSRNLTSAERARAALSNASSYVSRNLSVSALCGGNNKRDRDRNISTAEEKMESGKPNPKSKNTKLAPSLKSDEDDIADESK